MKFRTVSIAAIVTVLLLSLLFMVHTASSAGGQNALAFDSPLPTPPAPSPSLTPSAEAQLARNYIATKYGLPPEQLTISNEHRREYPQLGRTFQALSLFDLSCPHC